MRVEAVLCASLIAIVACGGERSSRHSNGPDASDDTDGGVGEGDGGGGGDGEAPADDAIVVEFTHRYGFGTGQITQGPGHIDFASATALVRLDGQERAFPATAQADGTLTIEGVPQATPYVLELRTAPDERYPADLPHVLRYPVDNARRVRLGTDHWGRQDAEQLDDEEQTHFALNVTTPTPLASGDRFWWIGLRSYFYRAVDYLPHDEGAPEEGTQSIANWTLPASRLDAPYGREVGGLPAAAAGDDFLLLQTRRSSVSTVDSNPDPLFHLEPWSRFTLEQAVGVLDVEDATFRNATTNTVSGALSRPHETTVAIHIKGSSFVGIREVAEYPKDVRCSVSLQLVQEAGEGPQVFTSVAPTAWSISTSSRLRPVDPACFPGPHGCSEACLPCNTETDGYTDPGDLSQEFQIPRVYSQGMRDLYALIVSYQKDWNHPDTGRLVRLSANLREARPASDGPESFALKLTPVTNLRLDGQPLSWELDNEVSGVTPTISFDAPGVGSPEYYEVYLMELAPDAAVATEDMPGRERRTAATLFTRETSVTVPEDVLRPGRFYSIYVYAVADGRNFAAPHIAQRERALEAGVFSPVFSVR